MSRTAFALVLVIFAAGPAPLFAQQPRANKGTSGAKIIEAALNLFTEMVKTCEELAHLDFQVKDIDLRLRQEIQTTKRLAAEIKLLKKAIDEREERIIQLEGEVIKHLIQRLTAEALAKARQEETERLLEELRNRLGVDPKLVPIRNANEPNPPAVMVQGKIDKIDAVDGTLVTISLGIDHGVNKNHTLDVYRAQPEAKYLGMIRIIESYQHKSVGRLIGNPAARPQLKVGDSVTSKITK